MADQADLPESVTATRELCSASGIQSKAEKKAASRPFLASISLHDMELDSGGMR